jgi:integrase
VRLDDDIRWLVALISDTGMRLSEAVGLRQHDLQLDHEVPHVALVPHATRRLKTDSSERVIPLVGASLWAAQRINESANVNTASRVTAVDRSAIATQPVLRLTNGSRR